MFGYIVLFRQLAIKPSRETTERIRGFAIVADALRTLASRTQDSTQEIHGMIQRIQCSASNAVTAMDRGCGQAQRTMEQATKADSVLQEIGHTIESINNMNSQIAAAAIQQSTVAEEISVNIDGINACCEKPPPARHKSPPPNNCPSCPTTCKTWPPG